MALLAATLRRLARRLSPGGTDAELREALREILAYADN